MKNKDRDPDHTRRREAGNREETPDGKRIAERLYGGLDNEPDALDEEAETEDEPTLFNDEDDDMAHSSKRKANRHERELVKIAEAKDLEAERAYASNGESLGEVKACDVLVRGRDADVMDALRIQAKRRKSIASYLEPPEGTDAVVVREDRAENLIVLPFKDFLDLLTD